MSFGYASRIARRRHGVVAIALLMGIWSCVGTGDGNDAAAQAASAACTPSGGAPAIHVCGNRLVDATGATVQLRGVNVSGLEAVSIFGWSPGDPWGGQPPDFRAIKSWGANSVRIPLNEGSWLGGNCVDAGGFGSTVMGNSKIGNKPGQVVKADPGGNYQATVVKTVAEAAKAGFYVILDLHLTAPGNACPMVQNAMADADHSVAFWGSVAAKFKGSPNVIFELFNEPFLDQAPLTGSSPWSALINGNGTLSTYLTQGKPSTINYQWKNAGMQQMLDAIRAAGAANVVLSGTLAYDTHTEGWLQYHPTDSLNPSQLGAVWHVYPNSTGSSLVNCIGTPAACSPATIAAAQGIVAAGYPVVITEFGDAVESKSAAVSSMLLPMADTHGMSYLAWTWNVWPGTSHYLITDSGGSPVPGFGVYVKAHYLCRAAGTADCK